MREYVLSLPECLSERQQREERHFEMLEAERDSDNGDAADEPEDKVRRRDLPPSQQNPNHIHKYAEAASGVVPVHHVRPERP